MDPNEPAAIAPPPPEPKPPVDLNVILGPTLSFMVKEHPTTPSLRGEILRVCNLYVPEEVQADQLAAYVQANYKPPVRPASSTAATSAGGQTCWMLEGSYQKDESGTCSISRTSTCSGGVRITDALLRAMAERASDEAEFQEMLESYVRANEEFGVTNVSSTEYEDEEWSDHDDFDGWEFHNLEDVADDFFEANPTLRPGYVESEEEIDDDEGSDFDEENNEDDPE